MKDGPTTSPEHALRARADALLEIGRAREAIPLLQSALTLDPQDAGLHCRIGQAFFKLGDLKQALASADRAVAAGPNAEWGHRLRSNILLKGRDVKGTLRAAEAAVSVAPTDVLPLYTLTRALLRASRYKQAQTCAERLRSLAPNSIWTHEALTLVALRRRHWREAEKHCRACLTLRPLSYAAQHNLGLALRHTGRVPEAVASLLEARRLNPTEPLVRRTLDETVNAYFINVLHPLLGGAAILTFLAFLPLGDRTTYGPLWLHGLLFVVATVLTLIAIVIGLKRFRALPPMARQRLGKNWHDR